MSGEDLASRAKELRARREASLTPEQAERRAVLAERQRRLQEGGIRRGPNAPKDGMFGGKPSDGGR